MTLRFGQLDVLDGTTVVQIFNVFYAGFKDRHQMSAVKWPSLLSRVKISQEMNHQHTRSSHTRIQSVIPR